MLVVVVVVVVVGVWVNHGSHTLAAHVPPWVAMGGAQGLCSDAGKSPVVDPPARCTAGRRNRLTPTPAWGSVRMGGNRVSGSDGWRMDGTLGPRAQAHGFIVHPMLKFV